MLPLSAVVALFCFLGLAACTSPEEQRAQDQARCSGYGFQPGSESFAHCMMSVDMRREAKEQADKDRAVYEQGHGIWQMGRPKLPGGVALSNNGSAGQPLCRGRSRLGRATRGAEVCMTYNRLRGTVFLAILTAGLPIPACAGDTVSIYFDSWSSSIDEAGNQALRGVAHSLSVDLQARATVTGYADINGDPAADLQLARQRSQAVVEALVKNGVSRVRLSLIEGGEASSAGSLSESRKVDVLIVP